MFKKIHTKKVYMKIVEQICDLVKESKLKIGDKLPTEHFLTEKFGTSRPSVREALSALEILGIIESKGGKGNFITNSFDSALYKEKYKKLEKERSPFEILEARKVVECKVAGLAAKRATREEIIAIQESLKKMKSSIENISKCMKFDKEFHIRIAEAIHNDVLLSIVEYLAEALEEDLWINMKEKSWKLPGHFDKYIKLHEDLLNLIKRKDTKGAYKEMNKHFRDIEKDLINL